MAPDNEKYDLAILGGRVIDPETGLDDIRNVGVKGGKIVTVTDKPIQGKECIDASGLVVAPGFIDMHHHNAGAPFGQKLALRDGVTTAMELEAGVYPVDEWYTAIAGKSRTNFGATVGTIAVREHVLNSGYKSKFSGDFVYDMTGAAKETSTSMKWSNQVATPDQIKAIEEKLEEGLRQGAIGIGHCPGYMVGGTTSGESMLCQKLVAEYGRSVFLHGRFSGQMPPTSGLLGFLEQMAPQEMYGGGLVIQHMTAQSLADSPLALKLIDEAAGKGIHILAEIYPYNYGGTIVGADYLHPDNYGPNMGREYKDIIETSNVTPLTKARYEELVATAPGTSVMFYNATEETVNAALTHPSTVLGSDAFPYTVIETGEVALDWDIPFSAVNGHPRGAGTHARMLRLCREREVDIPLMLAVSKMTYMIAHYLECNGVSQMCSKGRIQVGTDADITVFDPDEVTDNATMENGGLASTGIPYVVVNGTVMVRDSEAIDDAFPGQEVRCDERNASSPPESQLIA